MSPSVSRIALLAVGLAIIVALFASRSPRALDVDEWSGWVARFVTTDGRVVDTGNGGVSHSEGQGYGMLLATAFDDRETFARIWRWTQHNLAVRDDQLFAWRYDPRQVPPVADPNSAADGDLLIAWALARASERWADPAHRAAAEAIARTVLAEQVRSDGGRTILLPGPDGFVHESGVTVNLSYWLWPAFEALNRVHPSPLWARLGETGIQLLRDARFGPHQLPPDWLELGAWLQPSPLFDPVYGYNAIRIPLHLVWGNLGDPDLLVPFIAFADAFDGPPPATIDLISGGLGSERLSAGGQAILDLARGVVLDRPADLAALSADMDYFSASLLLLAKVALLERVRG